MGLFDGCGLVMLPNTLGVSESDELGMPVKQMFLEFLLFWTVEVSWMGSETRNAGDTIFLSDSICWSRFNVNQGLHKQQLDWELSLVIGCAVGHRACRHSVAMTAPRFHAVWGLLWGLEIEWMSGLGDRNLQNPRKLPPWCYPSATWKICQQFDDFPIQPSIWMGTSRI